MPVWLLVLVRVFFPRSPVPVLAPARIRIPRRPLRRRVIDA